MAAPLVPKPSLAQRLDLLAVTKPNAVKREAWFFGVLGVWTLIGTVTSLAAQHWGIASLTFATFAFSTFMWWASRRALSRIPETARWIEQLAAQKSG